MELAASSEKGATNEEVLREISNSGILMTHFMQPLSEPSGSRKTTAGYILYHLLEYERLLSIFSTSINMELRERKERITVSHEKQLKQLEGIEELEIS